MHAHHESDGARLLAAEERGAAGEGARKTCGCKLTSRNPKSVSDQGRGLGKQLLVFLPCAIGHSLGASYRATWYQQSGHRPPSLVSGDDVDVTDGEGRTNHSDLCKRLLGLLDLLYKRPTQRSSLCLTSTGGTSSVHFLHPAVSSTL